MFILVHYTFKTFILDPYTLKMFIFVLVFLTLVHFGLFLKVTILVLLLSFLRDQNVSKFMDQNEPKLKGQ